MREWKRKGILALVVCLLIAGAAPGFSTSIGRVDAAVSFNGGDGTLGDPYHIATAEQLNEIRNHITSHFILTNDIDLSMYRSSPGWEPIVDFAGSLDGQGYSITHLYMDRDSTSNVGLFSRIQDGARIEYVVIHAGEVRGYDYVGILAGESYGTIENVQVTGAVYGRYYVGGLIGQSTDGDIWNSYAGGYAEGNSNVGGLAGKVNNGRVTSSYAAVEVTSSDNAGGLIGTLEGGHVDRSFATGKVTGDGDAGGLIGGSWYSEVSISYATGDVLGCEDTGGLVGDNDQSTISNSYATGRVDASLCGPYGGDSMGGLVGDNRDGVIVNSYSTGLVISYFLAGGLAGNNHLGSITNSYYNMETSGQSDSDGQGLTTEAMKDKESYENWDFDTIWGADLHQDGYPYLKEVQVFLTYMGNGVDAASEPYKSVSHRLNSSVTIEGEPADWTRTGYSFNGWNTEPDGSGQRYEIGETVNLASSLLLYADWKEIAAPVIDTPANGQWTNESKPLISGTAEAGAGLVIMVDDNITAGINAAGDGSWSWTPSTAFADGLHKVRAGVADSLGNPVSLSTEHEFIVDTESPVITLVGNSSISPPEGSRFVDPGVKVTDRDDEVSVVITGSVDHRIPGTYDLQYDAQDRAGNIAESVRRTVRVYERQTGSGGIIPASNNANLAQLIVSAEEVGLTLSPEFSAEVTSYRVETSVSEVRIEAEPEDSQAMVKLGEDVFEGEETVVLTEGDNVFEVTVTAANGKVHIYSLTIHRLEENTPVPEEYPTCVFRDIEGHWAEQQICEAFEKGIVEGRSETIFDPQIHITRIEFAAMLLRTLEMSSETASEERNFTDHERIPAWAKATVNTAVANGILHGYPDHSLRPGSEVSRSEMIVMMAKALKWENVQGSTSFTDDAEIPVWAEGYVDEALQKGLISGREGNRFSPSEPATRAEATSLLLRVWNHLKGW